MTHASVFSGIGGPEVAATMLGWDNLFHCEINPFGRRVLDYWYPNSKSYEDITTTDFSEWRGRVNVLTGGFPCQPFSYAGKRGGAQDDRYLWPYMFRCIDQIRPDWVVAENVAGILTMVEQGEVSEVASAPALFDTFDRVRRYQLRETFTLQRICDDLEGHGYAVQPVLVPACGVGAPHRRDRVFIVAHTIGSGEATPRKSGSTQSDGSGQNQQQGERRAETERDNRLHAILRPSADTGDFDVQDSGVIGRSVGEAYKRWQAGRRAYEGVQDYEGCRSSERWGLFPTVSPIYRGNDGFPFPLDDLTISQTEWKREALRAHGNAIVPQVMYEIFRAIEQVEDSQANAW